MKRHGLRSLAPLLLAGAAAASCPGYARETAPTEDAMPEPAGLSARMLVQREWRELEAGKGGRGGIAGYGFATAEDGSLSVLILVEDASAIPSARRFARSVAPFTYAGKSLVTEIIETGPFYATDGPELVDPRRRAERPVPIGTSAGHPRVSVGTLGCRLRSRADPTKLYALGCSHVFGALNHGRRREDPIIQPGSTDGGTSPRDRIGTLARYVDLDFTGRPSEHVDAAIVEIRDSDVRASTPANGYGMPGIDPVEAEDRLAVMKYGRSAPFWAEGVVEGRVEKVWVYFGQRSRVGVFLDQILIGPPGFSRDGDSGALLVSADRRHACRPVGLLFAGSVGRRKLALATPIEQILSHEEFEDLELEVDGGGECRMPTTIEQVMATSSYRFDELEGLAGFGQGLCDGRDCLKVYVETLSPELRKELPTSIRGFAVQIEETGAFKALADEEEGP
jgi:hypothetical protein